MLLLAAALASVLSAAPARAAAPSACAYDGSFCVDASGLDVGPKDAFRAGVVKPLLLLSSGTAHAPALIVTELPAGSAKAAAKAELAKLRGLEDARFKPTGLAKTRVPRGPKAWGWTNGCLDPARCQDWQFLYFDERGRVVKAAFPVAGRERALAVLGTRRKPAK